MFNWLKNHLYNRKVSKALDANDLAGIVLNHDLINEENRKRIHAINLEGYRGTFAEIDQYKFQYDDYISVAGARFHRNGNNLLVKEGDQVLFLLEPSNKHSSHAVKIVNLSGHTIGYVPEELSESIFDELVGKMYYEGHIALINESEWMYPQIDVKVKVYGPVTRNE